MLMLLDLLIKLLSVDSRYIATPRKHDTAGTAHTPMAGQVQGVLRQYMARDVPLYGRLITLCCMLS